MQYFFGIVPSDDLAQKLRSQFRYGTEPHVTVKAQSGLTEESRETWTKSVRRALAGFGSFEVALGDVGSFGNRVAFLSVNAPRIHVLHALLVEAVAPTQNEMLRYHETGPYTPHLTVGKRRKLDFTDIRRRAQIIKPLPPFVVESVWLFRQETDGLPYNRFEEIRLTPLPA